MENGLTRAVHHCKCSTLSPNTIFQCKKKSPFMEGGMQKSELQLELACVFDNYEVKREGCAKKQSPLRSY